MGRLNHDSRIHHFSHPHPLELSNNNLQSLSPHTTPCSACKLQSSGWIYSCKPCNFTLHLSCSQLPSLINHPGHPIHLLTLLPTPAYPGGAFNCDGCGSDGHGFSYHCNKCGFDVHATCAQNPLSLAHQSHPHNLHLTFHPPYHTKGFSCDICQKIGSNHWLYRCGPCEFDAHLECAMSANVMPRGQTQAQAQAQARFQQCLNFPGTNHQYQQHENRVLPPSMQRNNGTTGVVDVLVQGFLDGAAHPSFVQSSMGDGSSNNGDSFAAADSSYSLDL
ncbi:hypothetical protein GH714_008908 [Hevea brasiliensis]|uniref:DC1 domain-containing protein n=1 Tax=Hevea brasiliensis TaxID=3981 RepID=A0A6A6NCV0_HEVBR|nr:hypothetical protein GH714_008908 [Hevea brasiliensis]